MRLRRGTKAPRKRGRIRKLRLLAVLTVLVLLAGTAFTFGLVRAVASEIPCVVVNVQRVGPSTGLPTKAAQGDVMQARWGTHGDHESVALCPNSAQECFDLTLEAFALADAVRVFATAIPIALIIGPVMPREYLMPTAILVLGFLTVLDVVSGGGAGLLRSAAFPGFGQPSGVQPLCAPRALRQTPGRGETDCAPSR